VSELDPTARLDETRQSWNFATREHNARKLAQAEFLARGGSTLFPEELELLGELRGKELLHLLCNSGQDTLSLAALGARVTGVDLSNVAVEFARELARATHIEARFVESEALAFLDRTPPASFDVVFTSYGALPWIQDLERCVRGIARVLRPDGCWCALEFHPMAWSFGENFQLRDPYFTGQVFTDPVSDYVADSDGALAPSGFVPAEEARANPHRAHSYQHTTAAILQACIDAGLVLEKVREYPYANGCKLIPGLVRDGRRFTMPPDRPSLPLMFGCSARKPR
jgi:SAM-dependent methyltransferase